MQVFSEIRAWPTVYLQKSRLSRSENALSGGGLRFVGVAKIFLRRFDMRFTLSIRDKIILNILSLCFRIAYSVLPKTYSCLPTTSDNTLAYSKIPSSHLNCCRQLIYRTNLFLKIKKVLAMKYWFVV